MTINYKLLSKLLFFISLILILNTNVTHSEILKKIEVTGNDRLAKETIILFSELNLNDNINSEELNNALRKLYDTDYFNDIKISFENSILKIVVNENPLIQSIKIEGIKNQSIQEDLSKITKKIEKYPYLENIINDQKNTLLNIIRNSGFYFAEIETIVQDNNNNSVNIIHNFELGERAKISEIKFVGNKIFKNNKLRNIIVSEVSKPCNTTNLSMDPEAIGQLVSSTRTLQLFPSTGQRITPCWPGIKHIICLAEPKNNERMGGENP